MIKSSVT